MSIRGGCDCNNIGIVWHTVDLSLVPRACQCAYCRDRGAAYVSKSGTRFEATIRHANLHRTVSHGANLAAFHECTRCDQVIFVTALIDDEPYGALNARHLRNKLGFPAPVEVNFSGQSAAVKQDRWRRNWCHPIVITGLSPTA